ncbi:helix-turn-helix domain-containing protein [Brevibacillus parabrevis]|uniref:helix-turn-helix domain-containing protein n=1 Tax=Brevibacillus parabrevis TaxID=54914 RepID=UPI002E24A6AE|nr:helix-turn-helix domain-containing protein [Brevibacillus parabrevis]
MEQLLTMQEAKDLLRVSYRTLHRLVSSGTIPSVKVGRVIRIPQAGLRKFILEDTTGGKVNDYQ